MFSLPRLQECGKNEDCANSRKEVISHGKHLSYNERNCISGAYKRSLNS